MLETQKETFMFYINFVVPNFQLGNRSNNLFCQKEQLFLKREKL